MVRAFWPYTRGGRGRIAVQVVLSLACFALTALLPLQVGQLLDTALSSSNAEGQVARLVLQPAAVRAAAGSILDSEFTSPAERGAVKAAIEATQDQVLVADSEFALDILFPPGVSYRTDTLVGIDEPTADWELVVAKMFARPQLTRSDVEVLRAEARTNTGHVASRAFAFIMNSLLVDSGAKAQRNNWQDHAFILDLARFAGLVLLIFALRAVVVALATRTIMASGRRLQDAVFERVHDTALVTSGAMGRPSMVSRSSTYPEHVQTALLTAQTTGVADLAAVVLSVGILILIDTSTGLLMVGVIVAFEVLRRFVAGRWSKAIRTRLDLNTALTEVADESITNASATRSLRAEVVERARFSQRADAVARQARRVTAFGETFHLSAFGFGQFSILSAIAIVGFVRNDLSLAEATAVVLYVKEVATSLDSLPSVLVELQEAAPYMRRLRRVLAAPLRRPEPTVARAFPVAPEHLVFTAVSATYPDDTPCCEGVSFTADRQRWTALVGRSASGIETVLDLAAGLENPSLGTVLVDGVDLAEMSREELRRHIAVLPAHPTVFEGTVLDNLTWFRPSAPANEVQRVVDRCGLREWLTAQELGLDTVIGRVRSPLRLEICVRLGVARQLLSDAQVVVLNDPSPHLDREVFEDLWGVLRSEMNGRIVVYTTDRLDVLRDDDQVLGVADGSIVERGTRPELLANGGWFAALWSRLVEGSDSISDLASVPALSALGHDSLASLSKRLVSERFDEGTTLYREGEPSDRVYILVDGIVDISRGDRRMATIRPGGYFGEFDPSGVAPRPTTAHARTTVVVRSLHRLAISAGVAGILDRPSDERAIYRWLSREGAATREMLEGAHPTIDVDAALRGLLSDGTVTMAESSSGQLQYSVAGTQRRTARRGGVLDTLFGD
ncbi:unannotated protein [freshwater metagenome]